MKMLLGVDSLQPLVMNALLETLPEYMSDGGTRYSMHVLNRDRERGRG